MNPSINHISDTYSQTIQAAIPYEWLLIPLIGVIIYFRFRKTYRKFKRQGLPSGGTVIGKYRLNSLVYLSRLDGDKVIQEWRVSPELESKAFENMPLNGQVQQRQNNTRFEAKVNAGGLAEANNSNHYGGKVSFNLSPQESDEESAFTRSDYQRYIQLLAKFHITQATDSFGKMSKKAWAKADIRRDIATGIRLKNGQQFTRDDAQDRYDLYNLIQRKNNYVQDKFGKKALAPWEDKYLHAVDYEYDVHTGKREVLYEKDLDLIKQGHIGFEPTNDLGITRDQGVHIGNGNYVGGQGHFLTFGGTRSGKGTSLVLPQLLELYSYPGSIIAIDVKGTLAAITADGRAARGLTNYILDPWRTQKKMGAKHSLKEDSFNPLDILDGDPDDLIDDCDMIAEMLIPVAQESKDRFWEDRARQWVSTYLLYLAQRPKEERTLGRLRSLFKLTEDERIDLFLDMEEDYDITILKENAKDIKDVFQTSSKEALGVLSHIQKELDIFKSPAMERVTNTSSFDLKDITDGSNFKNMYLIIPPERLVSHAKWLRVMIGAIISTVQRNKKDPVLLLMDEFYSLGYMEVVDKSMGLMPEYNLQMWPILQDLSQLQERYPKTWESFLANSLVTTWLGIRDNRTSEYLAKLMGTRTVNYKSDRALREELETQKIQASEKFELQKQTPLAIREYDGIFAVFNGQKVVKVPKVPYYEVPELMKLADDNPLRD